MSFDINACRQKFVDISGTIQYGEVTDNGSNSILRLLAYGLTGVKSDYDKILNDNILPTFPHLRSYGYEKDAARGNTYMIECGKNE